MGGGSAARKGFHPWTGWVGIILCWTSAAVAGNFVEPPVLASSHGVLDLLMIAQPQPVPSIAYTPPGGSAPINPIGWVYQFCQRAAALPGNVCPPGSATMSPYGGVRWALQQGDALKLRLVNRLPKQNPVEVDHSSDPGGANLPLNLTNIHTHGLIVPARAATLKDPTFGDYIFVQIYNPANGTPMPLPSHQDGSIVRGFADYRIDIPANHPSGLFWFHPHVHGITLNQVSGGLAGIISIGQAGDYARGDLFGAKFPESQVRYLTLKDMQVLAAGTIQFQNGPANVTAGQVLYQEDPTFCAQYPATPAEVRQGSCPGANNTADEGNNYTGGRWYWSVNGQVYPTINMTSPDGELWRLTNASGSATYDLQLSNDQTQTPMIMQLISVDGVSIDVPPGTAPGTMVTLGGARFKIVSCPPPPPAGYTSTPVCVSQFAMMPSSRAELWVTYRDAKGNIIPPPKGATGTFKTVGLTTGPAGDSWPAVDLAAVAFNQSGPRQLTAYALDIIGDALAANRPTGIFSAPNPYAKAAPVPANCAALPAGHHRRIFFGLVDPFNNPNVFGLGYEEVDARGAVVPGSQIPVTTFNPGTITVCLPLGAGQKPVRETWELVNLATENHNFHIHQTKFRFVQTAAPANSPLAPVLDPSVGGGIMEDNVPLVIATANTPEVAKLQNGYCTIDQWHNGQCTFKPVIVDIPFSQLGEFVFHCHILDHEDGGMMAKMQVVPAPY